MRLFSSDCSPHARAYRSSMRRKDRTMTEAETRALLEQGEYGVLSTVSPDGWPHGVPLHYCCLGDQIYFHCALEGEKLDNLGANPRVSFCVIGRSEILPAEFATRYESCLVRGLASEVFAAEKQAGLEGLIEKYSREFAVQGQRYIERHGERTRVFKISIQSLTGKARR